jgi:dual specificity MAP kinase phosphatase
VYGEDGIKGADLLSLALEISNAQKEWRMRYDPGQETPLFNTFALSGMVSPDCRRHGPFPTDRFIDSFRELEAKHPEMIAIDSRGRFTGQVMDFCKS